LCRVVESQKMAPIVLNAKAHAPMYRLIASKITDESDLAYALDLYDAIEEARILRQVEILKGHEASVLLIEEVRNRHISRLSELMSSCRLVS